MKTIQYRRLALVAMALLVAFALLEYRFIDLQWLRVDELRDKALRYTRSRRDLDPWRGEIRDRSGRLLASSVPVVSIYADLTVCANRIPEAAREFAAYLGMNEDSVRQILTTATAPNQNPAGPLKAVLLKQGVELRDWEMITAALGRATFGLTGKSLSRSEKRHLDRLRRRSLFGLEEQKRVYPQGNTVAHAIGLVDAQPEVPTLRGSLGIELVCDRFLAGTPGLCDSERNATGEELPFRRRLFRPAVSGNHVVLTIDLDIQKIVEHELKEACKAHTPRNAHAIVLRPRTGEVLAWASLPDYSPQSRQVAAEEGWVNCPLSNQMEPGSTFKLITLAAALEERVVTLDDWIDCGRGYFRTNRVTVRDHAPAGLVQVQTAFAKSSNVGFAKLAMLLGSERLYHHIRQFGFGQMTGIPLSGEKPGRVPRWETWSTMTLTRVAFGQGLSVTPLQMALAYSAVANDGRMMAPQLVKRIESPDGKTLVEAKPRLLRTVTSPATARQLREALQLVVSPIGTAPMAAVDGIMLGGKTGTAQKSNENGYLAGSYYASFIGLLPVEEPELCIAVALDEPKNGYYGSVVAAPVFKAIATQLASHLGLSTNHALLNPATDLPTPPVATASENPPAD